MSTVESIRAVLPLYAIEVAFPDLSRWRKSDTGIDYVHSFDSGNSGPHVMLLSLVHGNEVSGAIVVDALLQAGIRPTRGRLSLGFANVAAYDRFDRNAPDATRYIDEDLNRVWSEAVLRGPDRSWEVRRAKELRPIIDTVDLLLDLHSMHETSPPLMMCGPLEKGRQLAASLGYPEYVIIDEGHAAGTRLRDYGDFGRPASACNSLLLEAGQHFSRASVAVAFNATCQFVLSTGVVAAADIAAFHRPQPAVKQRFVEITRPVVAASMDFAFVRPLESLEIIEKAGTAIAYDRDTRIVTPHDDCVVVQPSLRHLAPGNTVVRLGKIVA